MLVTLVAALALSGTHSSAAQSELTVEISGVDASAYPTVRFLVTAADKDGFSPSDLTAANLVVESKDRRLPVSSVQSISEGQIGISALFALDTSGSMAGTPIVAARDAATALVTTMRPADEVAIVAFADQVTVASPYTQDFKAAQSVIAGLPAVGNTALYQAVADASKWASERSSQRRAVILLSDGADYGGVSTTSRQQSIDAAWSAGVPFYVVGLGSQIDRPYLQELASATRGRLFIAPTSAQVRQIFVDIERQVRTQYVVTLDLTRSSVEGDVTAKLTVRSGIKSGSADFNFSVPIVLPQEIQLAPAEDSGLVIPRWLIFSLAAVLAVVVLTHVLRKLLRTRGARRDAAFVPGSVFHARSVDNREDATEVLGRLVGTDGETYDLTRRLVSLGTDADSTYRLPTRGANSGSLRFWLANEQFMVHDTSPRPRMKLNGSSAKWGVLKHGDQLEFAGAKLRFESQDGTGSTKQT
jgi:Mg-chelatase subunit ChlD